MAYFIAPEVSRAPLARHELRSGAHRSSASPVLLLARRMIDQAFHDATAVGRDGLPTERALESFEWLSARTDWTIGAHSAPPAELREEFFGTFEWACRWLGEKPDRVREQGLQPSPTFLGSRRSRINWVRGMTDVKRRWEVQASRLVSP